MEMVLHDPSGRWWDGAVVNLSDARSLKGHGVTTIPVVPELFTKNSVAGYYKRAWGGGILPPPAIPNRICPLILYVVTGMGEIHWRARIVALEEKNPAKKNAKDDEPETIFAKPHGVIRLASDTSQAGIMGGGLGTKDDTAFDLSKLGEPDEEGGWCIGGSARVLVQADGFQGLSLYGAATGVRIAWAAVSQTP